MQFYQYRVFWPDEIRRNLIEESENPYRARTMDEPRLNHARSEDARVLDRRPFYRFWPGLFYALSKVDLSQIRMCNLRFTLPDNLHTIVIEFPKGISHDTYGIKAKYVEEGESLQASSLNSILIYQSDLCVTRQGINQLQHKSADQKVYFCVLCEEDAKGLRCQRTGVVFHENEMEMSVLDYLESREKITENQQGYLGFVCRILVILALLSNDDHEIFERIILSRDREKFDPNEAEKFWNRAKNNGLYGWDVGKNIPTREDVEEFKASGTLRGKVITHFRNAFFAVRWTGKGRSIAKTVLVRETIVNKDMAAKIPEGYYDDRGESAEDLSSR